MWILEMGQSSSKSDEFEFSEEEPYSLILVEELPPDAKKRTR